MDSSVNQPAEQPERERGPASVLNRTRVHQLALELASQIRPANHFSRVAKSFLDRIEAKTLM
jgi:hypothetical protein